jgi:hypothetical protein
MWLVIPERAELVRRLNREGIPVIASLTMPPEQGFYFNAENALLDDPVGTLITERPPDRSVRARLRIRLL